MAKKRKTKNAKPNATFEDELQLELERLSKSIKTLRDCCHGAQAAEYDSRRQVFNTKFQFRPAAIFMVESSEQVMAIVEVAARYPDRIKLRARSGGHDHEGESSGTDTWVIDFKQMNSVRVSRELCGGSERTVVRIGPGAQFRHVKKEMDKHGVSIAHGTCSTVCVAGYTMGGGWGPWTRRYGMGCERLIGATLIKGNGQRLEVSDTGGEEARRLLWALRGGGGFAYGILTELVFEAFDLPPEAHSFEVTFVDKAGRPDQPAIEVLRKWEGMIAGDHYPDLIGTNLMINAAHLAHGMAPDPEARLLCVFNGYYAGSKEDIERMVSEVFGPTYGHALRSTRYLKTNRRGKLVCSEDWHFHGWDRRAGRQYAPGEEIEIQKEIALETEGPAPHKITSRLAEPGWDDASRRALIAALQSELVVPVVPGSAAAKDADAASGPYGVHCYITIGAISGPYYASRPAREAAASVSFPYTQRPFTLQFQAWWDQYLDPDGKPVSGVTPEIMRRVSLANRHWSNLAEDWIESCRDAQIPHTSGAFISFKDDAVKTETYFAQHYGDLRRVKKDCSDDPHLLFQTRKTII